MVSPIIDDGPSDSDFQQRLENCIQENGHQLYDVINKK